MTNQENPIGAMQASNTLCLIHNDVCLIYIREMPLEAIESIQVIRELIPDLCAICYILKKNIAMQVMCT